MTFLWGYGDWYIKQLKTFDDDLRRMFGPIIPENSFEILDINVSNIREYDLPRSETELERVTNLNGRSITKIMQSKIIFWNILNNLNNSILLTYNYTGFGSNFKLKSVYLTFKGIDLGSDDDDEINPQ